MTPNRAFKAKPRNGDTLLLSPPLIVTEEQIDTIFVSIRRALQAIA